MGRVALALVCLVWVGCGKDTSNVGACRRFVAKYNSLPCLVGVFGDGGAGGDGGVTGLDPDRVCPEALNLAPCDISGYYDCVADHTSCGDGGLSAVDQCKSKLPACAQQP